jgi:hypothetical protein
MGDIMGRCVGFGILSEIESMLFPLNRKKEAYLLQETKESTLGGREVMLVREFQWYQNIDLLVLDWRID